MKKIKILQIPIGSMIPDSVWEKIKDIELPAEMYHEDYIVRTADIISKCTDPKIKKFFNNNILSPREGFVKIRHSLCQEISEQVTI